MKHITPEIIEFFNNQGFVIISSIDKNGFPHNSCKAIVNINPEGEVYLIDVYHGSTQANIKVNPQVSFCAVDEHRFSGYCLKGKASIMADNNISQEIIKNWESNITSRVAKRLIKNISGSKGHLLHPEAGLPFPKHIIAIKVEEVINLTPHHLRKE